MARATATRCGRRTVLATVAGAVVCGALAAPLALAGNTQSFDVAVRPGGDDGPVVRVRLQRTSDDGGVPSPARRTRLLLPKGLGLATAIAPRCAPDLMESTVPRSCDAAAVGRGTVRLSGIVPAHSRSFAPGVVRVFNGPRRRHPTLLVHLRVDEPIAHGWWLQAVVKRAPAPFGAVVDFEEAVLPVSGWPLTVLDLQIDVGRSVATPRGRRSFVRTPDHCPPDGWVFGLEARFLPRPDRPAGPPLTSLSTAACDGPAGAR